jgi:hypothetical protein
MINPLYRVNMSPKAILSLMEIEGFSGILPIPVSAFAKSIAEAIDSLEYLPFRFRQVEIGSKRGTTIHARVVAPFIIYYRVDESAKEVLILKVIHGARKQPRRL